MNILFLCTGNTCRSPMAEALARAAYAKKGRKADISSAGLAAADGEPASGNAVLVMARQGLDISGHRARQVTRDMLENAGLILAMGEGHKRMALAMCPACKPRLYTLGELAGTGDVSDPFGGDAARYEHCAKQINDAILTLTEDLNMIAIGSDHGGFELKTKIIEHLNEKGQRFIDFGTESAKPCDYPMLAEKVTDAVLSGVCTKGVLICGTGIGMSIAANRLEGIRCALCHDVFSAQSARSHNDANVLAMGGRVVGECAALVILDAFLETDFSGDERHTRRLALIDH